MIKSNRTILVLFSLSILLISNFYLLYKFLFDQEISLSDNSIIDDRTVINHISSNIDFMENNGLKIDILLHDISKDSIITLHDLFSDNDTVFFIVCRIHEYNCVECTDYALAKFFELDNIISREKLIPIIVGTYNNFSAMRLLIPENKDIDCFFTESINIPMDERGYPYFFVIDSSRRVHDVFAPNSSYYQLIDEYFSFIIKKWSKE